MHQKNIYKFYICLLVIFLISTFIMYKQFFKIKDITSPLPNFLTIFVNDQVSTLNLWSPFFEMFNPAASNAVPFISAKSALVYDLTSKKVLFAKNSEEKLPMASLTKIMTAIVAIESKRQEMKDLLDYSLKAQGITPPPHN